jgi:hypothetical protein
VGQWFGHLERREIPSVISAKALLPGTTSAMSELLELDGQLYPQTHGWTEVFLHIYYDQSGHKWASITAFKLHGETGC